MNKWMLISCAVMIAGCASSGEKSLAEKLLGEWQVQTIENQAVVQGSDAVLRFDSGSVGGNAGCNSFFASYMLKHNTLDVRKMGSTRKMCEPALMTQEAKLFKSLRNAKSVRLEGGVLELMDGDGNTVISASREKKGK